MADSYSHGAQIDPTAEVELREWAFSQPEADWDFEDRAEFLPARAEDCAERALTLMEAETDPNQVFHDRYVGTAWE